MRIVVAQLNPIIADFEGNTRNILASLDRARIQKADLVVFSELALSGYPPEDLLLDSAFLDANETYLDKIVQASVGLMVVIGVVRRNQLKKEKPLFNSAAVIQEGILLGFEDKQLLPTYDVFDERRYFEPGKKTHIWEFKGKKIGVMICEDIWQHSGVLTDTDYMCDPVLDLQVLQPDLVLTLSSSPYHYQKPEERIQVCAACATTLHCPVILCCQVGANDQLVFDGYSSYLNAQGQLVQLAKGFEEDEMVIDLKAGMRACSFAWDPIQDLYQALVLGVRDYFHKQGFSKGCLGLSGGIDSALVACLATQALGQENVLAVTMPSCYSSSGSVIDSEILAKNLGIELWKMSIEKPFGVFLDVLEPYFQGKSADVTEENLQARIRGILLMAVANQHGYLLLNTGNKSEMGVGYCTLYGDMAGGLAVLSDVTKEQVYVLARWLNRDHEVIPQSILDKAPSAELKPGQKDIDSLPSYDIVDTVLQGVMEDHLTAEEIAHQSGFPLETVLDLVKRIYRAEYKRRQAPPGIRVTKKAFGIGRRYPIVQKWI